MQGWLYIANNTPDNSCLFLALSPESPGEGGGELWPVTVSPHFPWEGSVWDYCLGSGNIPGVGGRFSLLHRMALGSATQVGRDGDRKWANLETLYCYNMAYTDVV